MVPSNLLSLLFEEDFVLDPDSVLSRDEDVDMVGDFGTDVVESISSMDT